jgi:hypothetical protein
MNIPWHLGKRKTTELEPELAQAENEAHGITAELRLNSSAVENRSREGDRATCVDSTDVPQTRHNLDRHSGQAGKGAIQNLFGALDR